MATNIEKLNALRMLGAVRQRMGAENETDESFDEQINKMNSSELVEKWCGWNLGDGSWWTDMKRMFDELEGYNEKIISEEQKSTWVNFYRNECGFPVIGTFEYESYEEAIRSIDEKANYVHTIEIPSKKK